MRLGSLRLLALLVTWVLIPFPAPAQQSTATSSSSSAPIPDTPSTNPPHAFWDRTNILLFSGVAVFRGLDYASTRNFLARGRDEILIPDDIVNNSAAFASLEAAGIRVVERVPHKLPPNPHNARYLATKRDRTGHQL